MNYRPLVVITIFTEYFAESKSSVKYHDKFESNDNDK